MTEQRNNYWKRIFWGSGIILVVVLAIGLIVMFVVSQTIPAEDPVLEDSPATETFVQFPSVPGTNLNFDRVRVPHDLSVGPKLIVVSYDESQQSDVDAWLPPLEALQDEYTSLRGYYMPLLPKDASDRGAFIIGGMSVMASNADRERTIVVFTNVDLFNELTEVPNQDSIQLFLLDEQNWIRWRETGLTTDEKVESLRNALTDLSTG